MGHYFIHELLQSIVFLGRDFNALDKLAKGGNTHMYMCSIRPMHNGLAMSVPNPTLVCLTGPVNIAAIMLHHYLPPMNATLKVCAIN